MTNPYDVDPTDLTQHLQIAVDILETRAHLSVYLDPTVTDPDAEADRLDTETPHDRPWWTHPRWTEHGAPNPHRQPPPVPADDHNPDTDPTPTGCIPAARARTGGRGRPTLYPVYNPVGIWCVLFALAATDKKATGAQAFKYLWEVLPPQLLTIVGMPDLHRGGRDQLFRHDLRARRLEEARFYDTLRTAQLPIDDTPDVDLRHRQCKSALARARANPTATQLAATERRRAALNRIIAASVWRPTYLTDWHGWTSIDETYHVVSTGAVYPKQDKPACATPMAFSTMRAHNVNFANVVGVHLLTAATQPYEPRTPTLILAADTTHKGTQVCEPTINCIDAADRNFPYKLAPNRHMAVVGDGAYSNSNDLNAELAKRKRVLISPLQENRTAEETDPDDNTPTPRNTTKHKPTPPRKISRIVGLAIDPATQLVGDDPTFNKRQPKQPWEPLGITQANGVLICPAIPQSDLTRNPIHELNPKATDEQIKARDLRLRHLQAAVMISDDRPTYREFAKRGRPSKNPVTPAAPPISGYEQTFLCPARAGAAQCHLVPASLNPASGLPVIADAQRAHQLRAANYRPCRQTRTKLVMSKGTFKYHFRWMQDSWFWLDAYKPNRSRQEETNKRVKYSRDEGDAGFSAGRTQMRSNGAVTLILAAHLAITNVNLQLSWNRIVQANRGTAPADRSTIRRAEREAAIRRADQPTRPKPEAKTAP